MAETRAELVKRPIDPAALAVAVANGSRGAVCSFVGTVRNRDRGRAVTRLDYECYEPMAQRELETIVGEAQTRFGDPAIVVEHRLGRLVVGDVAVAVVAAHERRASAIGAMQYVLEELKQRLPIWKLEHFEDGTREWVGAMPASVVRTA